MHKLSLVSIVVCLWASQAWASDSFINAPLVANNSTVTGDNSSATTEPGEPSFVGNRSMWYRYTAPARGIVRITTPTSPELGFYHKIHVFRGSSVSTLNLVEWSDGSEVSVSFPAEAGMKYYVCFASGGDSSGNFNFTVQQSAWPYGSTSSVIVTPSAPKSSLAPNDNFEEATQIDSRPEPVMVLDYNYSATQANLGPEPTESGFQTLWYVWKASKRGIATISTPSSSTLGFPHIMRVFRGGEITALTDIAGFDSDYNEGGSLSFPVDEGMVYRISFGSRNDDFSGPVIFTIRTNAWPYGKAEIVKPPLPISDVPKNDFFEDATSIPSKLGKFTILDYNHSATTSDSQVEPDLVRYRSLWYRWKAPEDGYVAISTQSNPAWDASYSISVWKGSSPDDIEFVNGMAAESQRIRFGFRAVKGKIYHISTANSYQSSEGQATIWNFESGPKINPSGPISRIQSPPKDSLVSVFGFNVSGSAIDADDSIKMLELKINGKVVFRGTTDEVPWNGIYSGRVRKGQVKIELRAQDALMRWGEPRVRYVTAQ